MDKIRGKSSFGLLALCLSVAAANAAPFTPTDPFAQCRRILAGLGALPRPLPDVSGGEVEVRIVSRKAEKPEPATLDMLVTPDGTVEPLLKNMAPPAFVLEVARRQGVADWRQLYWDALTDEQKLLLIEGVGQRMVEGLEGEAHAQFYTRDRAIPGLKLRTSIPIEVPPGEPLFIFGQWYWPGKHVVRLQNMNTAIEFGRPQDFLKLAVVEMHFQPHRVDITPGETALSIRNLLQARDYVRGKQHQHAIASQRPRAEIFGSGPNAPTILAAVASKLLADTNLVSELMLVRDMGRPLVHVERETETVATPIRPNEWVDVADFFSKFSSGDEEAEFDLYANSFKTFSVGLRGPAKFNGARWSLEFRLLFPEALYAEGRDSTVAVIDAAKYKMQVLAGQHSSRLSEDVATLERWFAAHGGAPPNAIAVGERFRAGCYNAGLSALYQHIPNDLREAQGPNVASTMAAAVEMKTGLQLQWLIHDWSKTHYAHLSDQRTVNEKQMKRVREAQIEALQALEKMATDATGDAERAKLMQKFVDRSGLQELVLRSLTQH